MNSVKKIIGSFLLVFASANALDAAVGGSSSAIAKLDAARAKAAQPAVPVVPVVPVAQPAAPVVVPVVPVAQPADPVAPVAVPVAPVEELNHACEHLISSMSGMLNVNQTLTDRGIDLACATAYFMLFATLAKIANTAYAPEAIRFFVPKIAIATAHIIKLAGTNPGTIILIPSFVLLVHTYLDSIASLFIAAYSYLPNAPRLPRIDFPQVPACVKNIFGH